MAEIWRPITGYEGLYEVSNLGNVASLNYKGKGVRRVLKQSKNTHGYPQVVLKPRGEKCKCFMTHRLVAKEFIPNPNNLPFVNHKDETRDIYVSDDEYTVIVDGNSVVLVFNPDTSRYEDRISKTRAFIQKLKDAGFEWSILSTSVVHINRYVISQFEDNEKNRKSAIDYFFKGLDGEEMAVCYQDDNVSVLRVYFEPREGTEYNINFSVSSSKTDKNGETEDLTSLLTRLEDNCYNLWRTVVPKRVLTVMKEDLKDAEQN